MHLKSLALQNFRSYKKAEFKFSSDTTLIVGPNTAGKTNLIEAIFFMAKGGSFRIDRDEQMVKFGEEVARIKARVEEKDLEVVIAQGGVGGHLRPFKKYLINGVAKRKVDFVGNFFAVIFSPSDLEIIIGSPGKRRDFIDNILIQADREYRLAIGFYEKGLRIRNALLHKTKETGMRNEKEFVYWDNLLIIQGQKITKKREDFIAYIQDSKKDVFKFEIFYDKSIISEERLLQYKDAEAGAGVTLVGPHRDDFLMRINENEIKYFGSRGQQRLAVLQLKLLELIFIEKTTKEQPILLLDDVFSELDEGHINLVLDMIGSQQTIITTTHEEFIPKRLSKQVSMIELKK
ncbi:MAG: DNA replication and repair protein RecF [bacterium]|nr:DNA replication and repair protein RecF [bacterium]